MEGRGLIQLDAPVRCASSYPEWNTVPGTRVCLLSETSKMPCYSWSLPAGNRYSGADHGSCPFAVFGEGSICGKCYAAGGNEKRQVTRYMQPATQNAQRVRMLWTLRCLRTEEGREEWIRVMIRAVSRTRKPYFRIHDSGDFFSAAYTRLWLEVCRNLPEVSFWVPTRSYQAPWASVLVELNALPNVSVRPSALFFGDPAPAIDGYSAGSTAAEEFDVRHYVEDGATFLRFYSLGSLLAEGHWECPAPAQGGSCGDCRVCWNEKDTAVVYHRH